MIDDLTPEKIDQACEQQAMGRKMEVIKVVRYSLNLGLREAMDFVKNHPHDLRQALEKHLPRAGEPRKVFENPCFKLEVKDRPSDLRASLIRFFDDVLTEVSKNSE